MRDEIVERRFVSAFKCNVLHTDPLCRVLQEQAAFASRDEKNAAAKSTTVVHPLMPNPDIATVCLDCYLSDLKGKNAVALMEEYRLKGL